MKFLNKIDLSQNEILNFRLQQLATAPSNPVSGQMYYNTVSNQANYWNGTAWIGLATLTGDQVITLLNTSALLVANANLSASANTAIANQHTHSNKTVLDAITASYTSAEQAKLAGISTGANKITASGTNGNVAVDGVDITVYTHPSTDGYLHVPATSTTHNAQVLQAGATAGSISWHALVASDVGLGNVPNLSQASLMASPTLTGIPVAPTASIGTNTTQLATTAFVLGQAATVAPLMDGAVAIGVSLAYARQDHVHASDTSRAPLVSPTFTGVPAGPTAGTGTNTTQLATTAFVLAQAATVAPLAMGVAAVGTSLLYARQDHVHLKTVYTSTDVGAASSTGTVSAKFQVDNGNSGPQIKNNAGVLEVRNAADNAYADLHVNNLTVDGTTTTINSTTVNIGDNNILLNQDITTNAANSDGGISIKRLQVDNVTRADAVLNFNNSTGHWETIMGPVAGVVTRSIANKFVAVIGDGSATSYTVTHNLNTQDVHVSLRDTLTPFNIYSTDISAATLNTVTLTFSVAPTTNSLTVVVTG